MKKNVLEGPIVDGLVVYVPIPSLGKKARIVFGLDPTDHMLYAERGFNRIVSMIEHSKGCCQVTAPCTPEEAAVDRVKHLMDFLDDAKERYLRATMVSEIQIRHEFKSPAMLDLLMSKIEYLDLE